MVAKLHQLVPKPERLKTEQAKLLLDVLRPIEGELPANVVRELKTHIQRRTPARRGWTFIMISPDQHRAVMRWIRTESARPMDAVGVWGELFSAVDQDTGEIMLTRDQIAELTGIAVQHVSNVMTELEGIGAIIRRRERVAGMRGRGMVRYSLNPVVGTHLPGGLRDEVQAEAPPGPLLRVMEGGKAPRASK